MCFGGKPKIPKAKKTPQIPTANIEQTPPISNVNPRTETGADQEQQTQKPRKKSLFQIDLTIPTIGANAQEGPASGSAGGGSAGAAVR